MEPSLPREKVVKMTKQVLYRQNKDKDKKTAAT